MIDHRVTAHARISTALSLLGDRRLRALVDEAEVVYRGVGGTAARIEVEGTPVFVKRVPLTELERRAEHVRSTANLFDLPPHYHYGLPSTGPGVWRELAAHVMTSDWVLAGRAACFPLLHHWRVLPQRPPAVDPADLEAQVEFWDSSPAVRRRLEAIAASTHGVVLFLEHFPGDLTGWLADHDDTTRVTDLLVRDLTAMNAAGLLHFDAHPGNVLTDGERLYYTDFGLAASTRFDLTDAERAFLTANADHDPGYAVAQVVNLVVRTRTDATDRAHRDAHIRRCLAGEDVPALSPDALEAVRRHGATTLAMNEFYGRLVLDSRETPFPVRAS
ncbi:hypothetical protein [Actinosynnema sp. NPDC020468]|uniref:hypothetical protein n=1 Tax=Actinosynnema sp. NPDC020468 TaxID=3154488 RepID=UPI0033FC6D76